MKKLWAMITAFFKQEAEKLRPLPFRQKIQYIWDYYRFHILAIVTVIVVTVSLVNTFYKAHRGGEVVFGVGIVNDWNVDDELSDYLSLGFGEYLGLTYGEQQVSINTGYSVTQNGTEYEEVSALMLFIDASSGTTDAAICESDVIQYFSTEDEAAWLDLHEILTEDELSALADRLYYTTDVTGNTYPCGIYLRDTYLATETSLSLDEPILVFMTAAEHREYMKDFLDYALQ